MSIGAGGMGEVYRALDSRLNRTVAIKVSREQFSERFEREACAIAALNHPNICTLYDVGPNYLVMELVGGPTLAALIASGAIPLEETLRIARQIGDALEAAHEQGIVQHCLATLCFTASAGSKAYSRRFVLTKQLSPAVGIGIELMEHLPTGWNCYGVSAAAGSFMRLFSGQPIGRVQSRNRADLLPHLEGSPIRVRLPHFLFQHPPDQLGDRSVLVRSLPSSPARRLFADRDRHVP